MKAHCTRLTVTASIVAPEIEINTPIKLNELLFFRQKTKSAI